MPNGIKDINWCAKGQIKVTDHWSTSIISQGKNALAYHCHNSCLLLLHVQLQGIDAFGGNKLLGSLNNFGRPNTVKSENPLGCLLITMDRKSVYNNYKQLLFS